MVFLVPKTFFFFFYWITPTLHKGIVWSRDVRESEYIIGNEQIMYSK